MKSMSSSSIILFLMLVFANFTIPCSAISNSDIIANEDALCTDDVFMYNDTMVKDRGYLSGNGDRIFKIDYIDCKIYNDDCEIDFDEAPKLVDGEILCGLRKIVEEIGGSVAYDSSKQMITISYGVNVIVLWIENNTISVNGEELLINVPAQIIDDKIFVPASDVFKYIGFCENDTELNNVKTFIESGAKYTLYSNGELIIDGNGIIPDYSGYVDDSDIPWSKYIDEIKCVNINKGIVSIGENSFKICPNLTEVYIPVSVKKISLSAFGYCPMLNDIYYEGTFEEWNKIDNAKNSGTKYALVHYSDNYIEYAPEDDFEFVNGVITKYKGYNEVVNIPMEINGVSVVKIADNAFSRSGCYQITVPNTITSIGKEAFSSCNSLRKIRLSERISEIKERTFMNCTALRDISLPEGITTIGEKAFSGCESLKNISLPTKLKLLDDCAFQCCNSLQNIIFSEELESMGKYVFSDCVLLENIALPDTITYIGDGAFNWCRSIKYIEIPPDVTCISENTFFECESLVNIYLPKNIQSIQRGAFSNCKALEKIILPEITDISENTFYNCFSLKSVIIPESIKNIDLSAFYGCYSLDGIYYMGSPNEWDNINICGSNEVLSETEIYYNYVSLDKYIVNYNVNGGNEKIDADVSDESGKVEVTSIIPTREHCVFLGWSKSKYNIIPEYCAGDIINITGNITLYAIWELNPYTITTFESYKNYTIGVTKLNNIKVPCVINIAKYNDGKLIEVEIRNYSKDTEIFAMSKENDSVKIMLWENLETMKPLCAAEFIKIG